MDLLQIVVKFTKLRKMSRYLIEQCGLISWLSAIVSSYRGRQHLNQRSLSLTQLTVLLQVVIFFIVSLLVQPKFRMCHYHFYISLHSHHKGPILRVEDIVVFKRHSCFIVYCFLSFNLCQRHYLIIIFSMNWWISSYIRLQPEHLVLLLW